MNKKKLEDLYDYVKDQLTQASTIRGIFVLVSMGYGEIRSWPLDQIVAVAVVVGAAIKILLPDNLWKSSRS